ncbi:MAG: hypothetical protein ACFFAS_12330 [Promethearchaeota archaeon]
MIKVKGTLISPYAVDAAMYSIKEVKNYLFVVDEVAGLDTTRVYVEGNDIDPIAIKQAISAKTFITPRTIITVSKESIPLIGRKGKRFIDLREQNPYNNTIRKFASAH